MPVELKVPQVGESITEVQIGEWLKPEGSHVALDEPVVVIESDKATVEIPAPAAGTVSKMLKQKGETALVGEVIGYILPGEAGEATAPLRDSDRSRSKTKVVDIPKEEKKPEEKQEPRRSTVVMPAAQRALAEHGLNVNDVEASGPGGRLLKEDVLREADRGKKDIVSSPRLTAVTSAPADQPVQPAPAKSGARDEEVVRMSPMRRKIAERLVQAQQSAALLTTFNEVDMSAVMALRKTHQDVFLKKYNVKLGFMSFFVKAAIEGLKATPQINAEVRGDDIVYHNYFDIGIAIGGGKGLLVPILRNAERLSFAEIEVAIGEFGKRAQENKIALDELKGGTFTISNGGIYGSMLSTPIVNPPQSGILGLHAIQDRPVARDGQVVIRPMMYLALTYDHRIVDGREAVVFLKRIKECIEDPARILLEI